MTKNQIDNLINFTLMFHKVCKDTYFMRCDASYITEKYDSMIGIDTFKSESQSDWWQRVILDDFKSMALKAEWFSIWSKKRFFINEKTERALNYLCEIKVVSNKEEGRDGLTLEKIIKTFNKHIGDVEMINKELYTHLHPIFLNFSNRYKETTKREINLLILTEGHTALNYQDDRGEETQPTIA